MLQLSFLTQTTLGHFCPYQGTCGNVSRHFWLSRLEKLQLASSGQRPGMLLNTLPSAGQPHTPKIYLAPKSQQGQGGKTLIEVLLFYRAVPGSMALYLHGRKSSPRGSNTRSLFASFSFLSWPKRTAPILRHVKTQTFLPLAPTGSTYSCGGNLLKKSVFTMSVSNFYSVLEFPWAYLRIHPNFNKINLFRD